MWPVRLRPPPSQPPYGSRLLRESGAHAIERHHPVRVEREQVLRRDVLRVLERPARDANLAQVDRPGAHRLLVDRDRRGGRGKLGAEGASEGSEGECGRGGRRGLEEVASGGGHGCLVEATRIMRAGWRSGQPGEARLTYRRSIFQKATPPAIEPTSTVATLVRLRRSMTSNEPGSAPIPSAVTNA